jgi:hypothetical protein
MNHRNRPCRIARADDTRPRLYIAAWDCGPYSAAAESRTLAGVTAEVQRVARLFDVAKPRFRFTARRVPLRLFLEEEEGALDDAAPDAAPDAAIEQVRSGAVPVVALDPAMYKPWTPDEKRQFQRLLCNALDESKRQ